MQRALSEYEVFGIRTNISFFRQILEHPDFVAGRCDTGFIDRVFTNCVSPEGEPPREEQTVAMLAAVLESSKRRNNHGSADAGWAGHQRGATSPSQWKVAAREAALNRWPEKKVASG
jgi:acetyl/propionyl-CoA carboxylase alpha subunit